MRKQSIPIKNSQSVDQGVFILLTEERYEKILKTVKQNRSVKLPELCAMLNASESTVRRDLSALDERGLIKKVHGGAI